MSFLDELRNGHHGLRFDPPDSFEKTGEFPAGISFDDGVRHVTWHVSESRLAIDLQRKHDEVLRQDTEVFVRAALETSSPRTEQADWSPVVELAYVDLGGNTCLRCVYRAAYAPGDEVLVGELLIPVATGVISFGAYARAGITGERESYLVAQLLSEHPAADAQIDVTQEQIDDPGLDVIFSGSPLSRVRLALQWLVADARPEITGPAKVPPRGEISLPDVGCVITPPPRYLPCPGVSDSMSPSLAMFSRVAPPQLTSRLLDVWRVPGPLLTGLNRRRRLKRLATQTVMEWEREGATELRISGERFSEYEGRIQLDFHVTFHMVVEPTQSAQRWFLDRSGRVFRIAAGGPPALAAEDLMQDIDQVTMSWRSL